MMMHAPTRRYHRLTTLAAVAALVLGLGACDNEVDRILPGERLSVLQLQTALTPSPQLSDVPVDLPEAWTNQFWPQVGGYPNHAMGHLALGTSLKKAWSASIGTGGDRRRPLTAAPVMAEGMVFSVDTDGEVRAFDAKNGNRKWEASIVPKGEEDSGAVGGGLAYASGRLYATSGYKYLTALNPQTGAQLWKTQLPSPARSAPAVMNEQVYVVTLDNRLLVFSVSDGAPQWNYSGVSESTNLLGSAAPAVDETLVVLPLSSGELYGLRPENGRVVWEDNLSAVRRSGSMGAIADIRGLPVIDQGVVFALSYSGRMVALDQVTGRRLWQREVGSAETPWAAGRTIFIVTTEQQLVALRRDSGEIHWVLQLPRFEDDKRENPVVWTAPILAGGRIITAGSNGDMIEVDATNGTLVRTTDIGDSITIAPLVAGETLYTLTQDGDLTAWR